MKRQMYGRAKIDLLEARLIGANGSRPASNLRQSQTPTPIDIDLLILDDFGMERLDASAHHNLLEILEER